MSRFEKKHWRESYNALILLEHLLTHGPKSTAAEFQLHRDVIQELDNFYYINERDFNWGLTVRKKSERILQLLEKGQLLQQERQQAHELACGIEGFGSFPQRLSLPARELYFERCNSHYDYYGHEEILFSAMESGLTKGDKFRPNDKFSTSDTDDSGTWGSSETKSQLHKESVSEQDSLCETELLLGSDKDKQRIEFPTEYDHPFNDFENQVTASLLSVS